MRKLEGIKAIFFDIDDTLFPSTEFAGLARKNAVRAMIEAGMKAGFEKATAKLNAVVKKFGSNYPHHLEELAAGFGARRNFKVIAAGIAAYHNTKGSIMPYPEVYRTLLALRDAGFGIYVATNGNALKQWDKLVRVGLHRIFEDAFVSEEVGVEKSPAFYRRILRRLKLKPEEALMVGDRPDRDVGAAKAVGMRTARVMRGKHAGEKSAADFEMWGLDELLKILVAQKNSE